MKTGDKFKSASASDRYQMLYYSLTLLKPDGELKVFLHGKHEVLHPEELEVVVDID